MTIDQKYERELVRLQAELDARIARFYTTLAQEIAPLISSGMNKLALERAINAKLTQLTKSLKFSVESSITKAWHLSNSKTTAYLDNRLNGIDLPDSIIKPWYDANEKALIEFIRRKDAEVTLSKRVFKQTQQAKKIIYNRIKEGISEGRSAVKIARDLRDQLVNPSGSEAPGRGVYKSPVANTKRLARTVTNKSYRLADHEAWKNDPIILGYEIQLSKSQSKKVKARCEICTKLAGKYPVSFVFVGWHPNCLCYKTPILMNDKQMAAYTKLIAEGKDTPEAIQKVREMKGGGLVTDVPQGFSNWARDNEKRVLGWKKVPEWWSDNEKFVSSALKSQPVTAPKIDFAPSKIGDYENKYGVKVDRDVFTHLNKETPLYHRGSRAYYQPDDNYVNIPYDERRANSKWKAESVVYHEFGHAADWQNGYRDSTEVKNLMDKYKSGREGVYRELTQEMWETAKSAYSVENYDAMEQATALADTIKSLDIRFGFGHDNSYFRTKGYSEAEFIAHAFENKYIGNPLFKKHLPYLYDDMIKLIEDLLKRK